MDIYNLLNLYLELLDRNVPALLVYCNKLILPLLGLRELKHVIVQSAKEEEMFPLLRRQVCSSLPSKGSALELVSVFSH